MKGLMLKDLMLLREQGKTLLMIMVGGICMSLAFEPTTVISYLTIIAVMTVIGTINYDEYDNGFSYLFTLPVERKTYVRAKYAFSLLWTLGCLLLGTLISILLVVFRQKNFLALSAAQKLEVHTYLETAAVSAVSIFVIAMFFMTLMIPLRIKYGSEQGKIMQFLFFAIAAAAIFAIMRFGNAMGVDLEVWFENAVSGWKIPVLLLTMFLVSAVLLIFSEQISEHIIRKKEY